MPDCRLEIRPSAEGSGPFAIENPIRGPEKWPCGGWSVITVGPQLRDATAPLRHPTGISAPPGHFSVCRSHGPLQGFLRERARAVSRARREFPRACRPPGDEDMLRKANNCERPVARVSRETAARAPEIPAGHGPAVRPTSRGSGCFPGRLAVRRAACLRPACRPAFKASSTGPDVSRRGGRKRDSTLMMEISR